LHLGEAIGRCYPKKQNEVYADLDTSICAEYYILNLELLGKHGMSEKVSLSDCDPGIAQNGSNFKMDKVELSLIN